VLHGIEWVIYVYYFNFVKENIWRNNFKKNSLEVIEDEKNFKSPRIAHKIA
jgi:hypothetical protein